MARPRSTDTVKVHKQEVKDFNILQDNNNTCGIQQTLYTIRDKTAYLGRTVFNGIPYPNAVTDLFVPNNAVTFPVGSTRCSGSYIFELDTKSVIIAKLGTTIYFFEHVSGSAPTAITSVSTLAGNREVYLEAIFCATEKASTTGYVKYAFLNLPGEAWVVAYNTRIGAWQIEKVNNTYSVWAGTTAYSLGNRRIPTVANGYYYEVTVAGTSAAGEPVWPTTIGNTVTDGTVTWICRGRYNNFPTTTSSSVKTLNGYIFVCVGGDIYNSDLDLPDSWNTSDFISTEIYPDDIVALAKYKNYLVAFGENTIEFFYDAANISGTPLARQEGILHNIGCAGQALVTDLEDRIIWISQSGSQNYSIWEMDKFEAKKISTPETEVLLTNIFADPVLYRPETIHYMIMFLMRLNGRILLVIPNMDFGNDSSGTGATTELLVLDLDLQATYTWEMYTYPETILCRPFFWKNYFLLASKQSGASGLQFSCFGVSAYDLNLSTTNMMPLINQTPRFYTPRIDFGSTNYKVVHEVQINGFPSVATNYFSYRKDQAASGVTLTVPSNSYKVHRLGRGREFQFIFTGEYEISDITIKYTEHSN